MSNVNPSEVAVEPVEPMPPCPIPPALLEALRKIPFGTMPLLSRLEDCTFFAKTFNFLRKFQKIDPFFEKVSKN